MSQADNQRRSEEDFILFWHRLGNSRDGIRAGAAWLIPRHLRECGRRIHVGVEGDLKWSKTSRGFVFYFYHGRTGLDLVRDANQISSLRESGLLLPLFDIPSIDTDGRLLHLLEIKAGEGPFAASIPALAEAIVSIGLAGRVVFASSSLSHLQDLKAALPGGCRTMLFSQACLGGHAFLHLPKVDLRRNLRRGLFLRVDDLEYVDMVCNTGPLQNDNLAAIRRATDCLGRHRIAFIPGASRSLDTLRFALRNGNKGMFCYAHPEDFSRRC
jgi:hypothetical protein